MRRRYVASKRHTIQVDFDDYLRTLGREARIGAARRGGLTVTASAEADRAHA
jgi:hypothetical protein